MVLFLEIVVFFSQVWYVIKPTVGNGKLCVSPTKNNPKSPISFLFHILSSPKPQNLTPLLDPVLKFLFRFKSHSLPLFSYYFYWIILLRICLRDFLSFFFSFSLWTFLPWKKTSFAVDLRRWNLSTSDSMNSTKRCTLAVWKWITCFF